MNTAQYTGRCSAAVVSSPRSNADFILAFSASKIHTTLEDFANFGRPQRCGSCSIAKSSSRKESALSVTRNLSTVATSYRTTDIRKEWAEPGAMTIRKTSKPFIGGATLKRDRVG